MLIHTFYTIAVLIYLLRCLLPRVCTVVIMSSFPIRRTVFRDSELEAELLEDLAIDSYQQEDLLESHEVEAITDNDEKANPLRQFWSHEEILEVNDFFRHSSGDGEELQSMLAFW